MPKSKPLKLQQVVLYILSMTRLRTGLATRVRPRAIVQHRNLETDRLKRFVKISLLCWVRSPKPIITPILKHDDFGRPYP